MTHADHPDEASLDSAGRNWLPFAFLAPAALMLLVFMAVPMANSILLSFQSWNGMSDPVWVGFKNYRAMLGDRIFVLALANTAYFTIATVLLQSILPLLVAALLSSGIRGGVIFRTALFHAGDHLAGDQRPALGDDLRAELRHPELLPARHRPRQLDPALARRPPHRDAEHHRGLGLAVARLLPCHLLRRDAEHPDRALRRGEDGQRQRRSAASGTSPCRRCAR